MPTSTSFRCDDLVGLPLDWAVGMALGCNVTMLHDFLARMLPADELAKVLPLAKNQAVVAGIDVMRWDALSRYSTSWSAMGPKIDWFGILFDAAEEGQTRAYLRSDSTSGPTAIGKDHLTAAARLIVRAKLGETVEIPGELA